MRSYRQQEQKEINFFPSSLQPRKVDIVMVSFLLALGVSDEGKSMLFGNMIV
jgi:hypothetical protein